MALASAAGAQQPPAPAAPAASASAPAPVPVPVPAPATPDAPQQVVVEGRGGDPDSQRRLAIGAVTVVGREELDAQGDTSVLDVLQRLPGITIDGETPRLRGLGAGYTLILINGEPAPPGFTLDSLSPADIERIEIIKGPSAEFGGTAGTINVILRGTPKLRQRELRATLGWRAVRPQGNASLGWGDRVGALGWHLPFTVNDWVTRTRFVSERVSRSAAGVVSRQAQAGSDRSEGQGVTFSPRLDWKLNPEDTLQVQLFLQRNENRGASQRQTQALAGPLPYSAADASNSESDFEVARGQAQWQRKLPDGQRLELKGSAQSSLSLQDSRSQGITPAGLLLPARQTLSRQREGGGSLGGRWRLPLGQTHMLNLGVDVEERERRDLRRQFDNGVENITGSLGSDSVAASARRTVFAQDDWEPAPGWSVSLGLRGTQSSLRSEGPEGRFTQDYSALLPLVNLRHAFDPAGRQLLRVSLARSQRLPDLNLLLPRYVLNWQYDRGTTNTPIAADSAGNPALRPERTTSLDVAFEQHVAGGGVASVGVFHRRIERLIRRRIGLEVVAEASAPRWVSRPVNLGSATSSGLELEWKGRPLKGLNLRAAASLYRSSVEQIDDPDARLEGQPPWSATFGMDYAVPATRISWGASLAIVPAFATQQSDLQRQTRGANRRLDAFVLWRYSRELQLRLAATNLLAEDALNSSSVADIDGFAASGNTRRQTLAVYNASLVWRF